MTITPLLRALTERIVRSCDPDRIVLFGSYAKGQQHIDSDVDLLVIGAFADSPYLRGTELRQSLQGYPIRIDLHLVTPAELAVESRKPFGFLNSVLSGVVDLYRKDPAAGQGAASSHFSSHSD